jgi:hypothetical protein
MAKEHDVSQSQKENLSMPLENEELEIEFIQSPMTVPPNPTYALNTMESLLQRPLYKDCRL